MPGEERVKVAIIGAGYSGVTAAIRLLERSAVPVDIQFIEKEPNNFCGGVAYGLGSAECHHQTNISARSMGVRDGDTRVLGRREFGDVLKGRFLASHTQKLNPDSRVLPTIYGSVVDIAEKKKHDRIVFEDGTAMKADYVIVATGNHEMKSLPCVTAEKLADPAFEDRMVSNQWVQDEKDEIRVIPEHEPVLVIGTALSGYDAVRTLLRRGHEGPIVMMSRNGYEHFQYPKDHDWSQPDLPVPMFVRQMAWGFPDDVWTQTMLDEFKKLTSIEVNPQERHVEKMGRLQRLFNRSRSYLPEQVLRNWERYVPEIIGHIGVKEYGRIMGQYSSLISTLRVGAGHDICEEINAAKKSGQLSVIPASINNIDIYGKGEDAQMHVTYTETHTGFQIERGFHTVISSLGANQNYARTQDPLWRRLMDKGYTEPHPVGVGVTFDPENDGCLSGAKRVYVAGTPRAGHDMVNRGILGPPAFSVPGMTPSIHQMVDGLVHRIHDDFDLDIDTHPAFLPTSSHCACDHHA